MTAQPLDGPRGWYPKQERDKLLRRIDDLEAEIAELRDRTKGDPVSNLVARICSLGFPLGRGLVLAAFYRAPPQTLLTVDQLINRARVGSIWAFDRPECASDGALKSQICYLRRQWAALGAQPSDPIENVYRVGYRLRPEARAWLDAHLPPPIDPITKPNGAEALTTPPNNLTHADVDNASGVAPCAKEQGSGTISGLQLQGRRACTVEK